MLLDLLYSEDIDIKDLEKYFLASSQGQAPGFSPKNFITGDKSQRIILLAGMILWLWDPNEHEDAAASLETSESECS